MDDVLLLLRLARPPSAPLLGRGPGRGIRRWPAASVGFSSAIFLSFSFSATSLARERPRARARLSIHDTRPSTLVRECVRPPRTGASESQNGLIHHAGPTMENRSVSRGDR